MRHAGWGKATLVVLASVTACSREPARVGLVMRAPQGLLDDATAVTLSVFAASAAKCLPTGHVTDIPAGGTQTYNLERSGCGEGVSWCKEIELDKDDSRKMFAVVAENAFGVLAEGCAVATIDQDPLEVDIQVHKFNVPACCNDGELQAGEQCDVGQVAATDCSGMPDTGGECRGVPSDGVCECDCLAKEIPIDRRFEQPLPAPLIHVAPSMAFTTGAGEIGRALRVAYQNIAVDGPNSDDVEIRVLKEDLYPTESPPPLVPVLDHPLKIPLRCTNTTGPGSPAAQRSPSIATVSNTATAVVYLSDQPPQVGGLFAVFLSSQDDSGCAAADPVRVNAVNERSQAPDVAGGPTDLGLVVWTNVDNEVRARVWQSTSNTFTPPADDIAIADNGALAKVAGSPSGWLVVYQGGGPGDGDGVFLVRVDANGVATAPMAVNLVTDGIQDQPDVAVLEDGRALVVWRSGGDIWFQRYAADGTPNPEDQASPIHADRDGEQAMPAAAASVGYGDFFVVAWQSTELGTVSARLVGGTSGFRFNSVTGQNDNFVASHPLPGVTSMRRAPMAAVGGAGFIALGWQDDSLSRAGIYVRRFPLPAEQ